MVAAPLVMPEVIIGLSLLLMLVSLQRATEAVFGVGFPERGMLTIWLGHLLLGMAYATVVVRARLQTLNPQLEEAALDLGARPWQVFWLVTLPMIGQALLSAFLLTFTLSLDDVVLSAFLSGPGATTMPLVIFSRARLGLNPSVNAVATIIIAARRDRRRRRQLPARAQRAPAHRSTRRSPTGHRNEPARVRDLARLPLPRRGDGRRRRLRRLLEGAGHRLSGLPARRLRFAIAAVAMAPWLRRPRRRSRRSTGARHRLLFLESFFGNFLFSICMLFGVRQQLGARRRRDHGGAARPSSPCCRGCCSASASACASRAGIACAIGGIALVALARDAEGELASGSLARQRAPARRRDVRGALRRDRQEALGARRAEADQRADQPLGPRAGHAARALAAAATSRSSFIPPSSWVLLVVYSIAASVRHGLAVDDRR